jgi:hypothetical protein
LLVVPTFVAPPTELVAGVLVLLLAEVEPLEGELLLVPVPVAEGDTVDEFPPPPPHPPSPKYAVQVAIRSVFRFIIPLTVKAGVDES